MSLKLEDGAACPICRTVIDRDEHVCTRCLTRYHRECWDYYRGCAIYACPNAPEAESPGQENPPVSYWCSSGLGRKLVASGLAGFLLGVVLIWPRDVKIEPFVCRTHGEQLVFSWGSNRAAQCVLELATDPLFERILLHSVTRKSRWHEVVTKVDLADMYHYRVRSLDSSWLHDSVRSGQVILVDRTPRSKPEDDTELSKDSSVERMKLVPARTLDKGSPSATDFFSSYTLKLDRKNQELVIQWSTKEVVELCRVIFSRDSSLRGVEKIVDAVTSADGTCHRVILTGVIEGASYHFIVLAVPKTGSPIQSSLMAFDP